MSKSKGPFRYAPLVQKIQEMDSAIKDMKMRIEELKTVFCENGEQEPEVCPDEVESDIAMMEIMRDICIDAIGEEDPEGDA